jgi:hypothetical protein
MFFLFIPHPRLALPQLAWHKPLLNAHPFSQSSSHPPPLMSFWMTLFSYQIRKPTRKVKSTLQRNPGRKKKGKRSTNPVFYHHPQNKKKNESGPMADEETPEDSSNTSDDSASKPLCPPGAQDAEPSAVTPGKAKAE